MKTRIVIILICLPFLLAGQGMFKSIGVQLKLSDKYYLDYNETDTVRILENDIKKFKKNIDIGHDLISYVSYSFKLPEYLKDGKYICYYDSLKTIIALKFSIKNNKYQNLYEKHYPHGTLYNTVFYIDGKKNGLNIIYYTSGNVQSLCHYVDDHPSGFEVSSFYNSTLSQVQFWTSDTTYNVIESWALSLDNLPTLQYKKTIKIKNKKHYR